MRRLLRTFVRLMAIIVLLFPFGLCAAPAGEGKPVIHFGVIPRYNPLIMIDSYQPIMDYLTEVTPYRFELRLAKDYKEAVGFLRDRDVEVASLGDVTFVDAYRSFGAVPIVRPLNRDGEPYYRSLIVVRSDSDIQTVEQLKGRTVAFGSPHSTSGNLIPRLLLFHRGVRLEELGSYTNLGQHDAVAKEVLKGRVDAGALKDVVAEHYQEHGLRVLTRSEPIPTVPIVVHPDTPAEVRAHLRRALLGTDPKDPETRTRLEDWDAEFRNGFVEARVEDYAPIFQLLDSVAGTCGEGCHR